MNETIDKLTKESAAHRAAMTAAFTASEAEGVAPDDKAKHLAAFETAEARYKDAEASLTRATRLRDADAAADRRAASEREPARPPVVLGLNNPHPPTAGQFALPAAARRHGPLVAFKGADADRHAYHAGLWAGAALYGSARCHSLLAEMGGSVRRDDAPAAVLNTLDNSKGGYFVPDEMDRTIIRLIAERYGNFRRLARVVPMGSDTKLVPRSVGGMAAYWIQEGQAPTESEPKYDMIQLVTDKLGVMIGMTEELDEDSIIDFGDEITNEAALAFGAKEDAAGFNGDGTQAHGGNVGLFTRLAEAGNAASVVTAATTHTTPDKLTLADFYKVIGLYPNYPNVPNRKWYVHQEVWAASMLPLQLAVGGTTPEDIRGGGGMTFLSYPVEIVNSASTLAGATAGTIPVAFGDMKLSSIFGDRRTNRTLQRGQIGDDFARGIIRIKATERLDIVNHTIVDPRDTTKPGPIVGLKLAAS